MILASMLAGSPQPEGDEQSVDVGEYIIHHVQNHNEWNVFGTTIHLPQFDPITVMGLKIDLSITNHVVMLWIASLILLLTFTLLFRKRSLVPKGFAALLEMLVVFIRDEIAIANLGEKHGKKFAPLIITFFFFILTCNLLGMIPLFTTPTGNINVTAALAIITFVTGQVFGIRYNGLVKHVKSLVPTGVPLYLLPLMFVIEIMGLLAKHFALIVRLFANMIAGHIVFFAFLGLIFIFKSVLIAPLSVGFALFVDLLEILVAFIQAYVFTILSSLFIGMSIHPGH
jgi:F-type H+-transporting ATPase subunit a